MQDRETIIPEQPEESDPPDDDFEDHGRIGYGRYGRYSPAILGLLIVAVVAIIGFREWQPEEQLPRAGKLVDQPAPAFSLERFEGDTLTLADLEGQAVVLNFWASWCVPCRTEMPTLQEVADESLAAGLPVTVVGVGIKNDYSESAKDLVEELGITYPIGRDTAGDDPVRGPIEAAYGVVSYPTTVFIRPDGTVFAIRIGAVTKEDVQQYLDATLDES